jgi:hypothetical protein
MSEDAHISNVALIVLLTLVVCIAWSMLTGEYWFWFPVIAALAVTARIKRRFL